MTIWHKIGVSLVLGGALLAGGCGGSGDGRSKEVVLVTHDSFAIPKQVKAAFEQESGLKLRILQGGDAGEIVNRALLTKGNPQGDVLFGIDNNLLSRALDERACSSRTRRKASSSSTTRYRLDPDQRRDAGRPRRRLPQRRQAVVRLTGHRTADDARRAGRLRATASCSSSRIPPPRRPGWRSCWPRSPASARAAGRRLLAAICARTASSSSTAGRRRTPRGSRARAAARASGRSSSPTRRAPRQR